MRKITLTLMVMLLTTAAWTLQAQTTVVGTPLNQGIPDGAPATTSGDMIPSVATVADTGTIGTDATIDGVEISLTHTFDADLDISLVSPMGTSLDLSSDNGGLGDNYTNTVFQDGGADITAASAPFTGVFEPEGGTFAATFDGEPIAGDWELRITDDTGGDWGTFLDFQFTYTVTGPAPISDCNTAGIPIVDNSTVSAGINIGDSGAVGTNWDINNVEVDITHTFDGDLDIELRSPAGTTLMLSDSNGGAGDNYIDTIFQDGGGDINASSPPYTGTFEPEGGTFAATFAGEDINGDWFLDVTDNFSGDSGTIDSFCITFDPIVGPPNTPPTINCPADVVASTDPGVCGATVVFADAVAIDLEDGALPVTQTMGPPSGSVFPTGDTIIEFSATDSGGATVTCQFTITVNDDEAPMSECQDLLVELDENGVATVPAGDFLSSSSDNCGIVDVQVGSPPGAAGSLTTTFAGGNGFQGNMFEIVALTDLTLNSVDVNMDGGVTDVIEVYWKAGSYVGSENNAGDWTLGGSANVTSAGTNTPTPLNLNMGISLAAGNTYAIYVTATTTNSINYTNGTTEGALWVSNAELEVYEGVGRGNPPFAGSVFSPRNWNGTLHYDTSGEFPVGPDVTFDCSHAGTTQVLEVTVTDAAGNSTTCTTNVTIEDNIAPEIVCIGEFAEFSDSVSDSPGVAIPDSDPTGVSTTINIADDVEITDLNVDVDITHTWVGDLQVVLESPAGTQVMIIDRPGEPVLGGFGCSGDDILATLDDEAADPVEDQCDAGTPTILGTFSPNEALSAFDGESTLGDWILTVIDNAGGDTGTLNSWGMTYSYETVGTPLEVDLDANGMATINAADLLLGVDEACGWTATVGGVGAPTSLETTFAAGNNFHGNMFDINVINGVTFNSFDVHLEDGITDDIEVYFKTGSYVGFETDAGAWTLLGTSTVTSAGLGAPTPLNMDLGLAVAGGETVAFYVTTTQGGLMQYTNGTAVGNVFASDAEIEFLEGNGGEYPFNVTFSPRVFNGNIHYSAGSGTSTTIDFTCEDLGENQIEVTVTDDSGNVATCIATVNVNDVTSPILVCQDIIIELDENGHAEVDPADLLATLPGTFEVITISSDNGSNAEGFTDLEVDVTEAADISFDWVYSTDDGPAWDSFGYLLNGVYTELTDPAGDLNQSGSAGPISVAPGDVFGFRSFSADGAFGAATTVVSNFMPGFEGQFDPDNWVLTLDNSDGDAYFVEIPGGPLSFDACGITVLAVDVTDVYCEDIGDPIPVVVFASDASGNIAACNAFITVVDAMGPMITCPEDQTVDPGEDNLFYEVPDYWGEGLATATDNCTDPVTITTQDPAPGDLIPDGVYTVTLTAEDEYGNVSTCEFELTVESVLGITDSALDRAVGIYPNPAENQFTIHNSSSVALSVANIYDVNGKLIRSVDLSQMAAEQTIDVSLLASGVYMVHIIGDEASAIKRLLKE